MLTALIAAQLGAHVHGQAALSVVQEGPSVEVVFATDLASLVGFEHAPRDDAERAAFAEAEAGLGDHARLFSLGGAAGCAVEAASVEMPFADEAHDHHDDDGHDDHAGHADASATFSLTCARPEAMTSVRTGVFDAFPRIEAVEVVVLTEAVQTGGTLTPRRTELRFR